MGRFLKSNTFSLKWYILLIQHIGTNNANQNFKKLGNIISELLDRITLMSKQFHRLNYEGHNHVSQMTYGIALALGIQLPNRGPDWLRETMISSMRRDYEQTYIDPGGISVYHGFGYKLERLL